MCLDWISATNLRKFHKKVNTPALGEKANSARASPLGSSFRFDTDAHIILILSHNLTRTFLALRLNHFSLA